MIILISCDCLNHRHTALDAVSPKICDNARRCRVKCDMMALKNNGSNNKRFVNNLVISYIFRNFVICYLIKNQFITYISLKYEKNISTKS